jgi:hypothetical protein
MGNQPLPGTVSIQFFSWPFGIFGPNQTSTEPSSFFFGSPYMLTEGNGWLFWSCERLSAS